MENELQLLQDRNERLEKEVVDLLAKLELANEKIIELEKENKELKTYKEETSETIAETTRKVLDGNLDYFKNEIERNGDEEAKKTYHELKEKGLTDREIITLLQMEETEAEKKYEEIIARIEQTPK